MNIILRFWKKKIYKSYIQECLKVVLMIKNPHPLFSEKTPNENECYPCSRDSLKIKATSFCKTCDDPEPLCEACAKQHTRQKIAKDHEISRNMAELSKRHPVTSLR